VLEEALTVAASWGLTIREANTDRGREFFVSDKSEGTESSPSRFQEYLARQCKWHGESPH